mmetsp:Transcript_30611/g.50554  ORF Transcript_30611/g.50554 Transcript_30611/m.50554 type:complete len:206 (+) Transcript_30611:91-708(+)|eukprot:CAMPEP_0119003780 /NCGR_PEP_ID=MMETSP1176-20130426/760_1 /TAXON_ID=265551 /ORGANISM="Synedropsis recta cf, Strain CCMP1620" /LENGTH=205 /DNA_ID=CAMNT_0006955407 /DNA_START=55 /DNA_END=672 /DNA_ORIENTATION=+
MGLIHTPRVLYSIAKGAIKNWRNGPSNIGIGAANPHVYTSRVDLFDFDLFGHLNNAAYLTHAERARWQLSAENGTLASFVRNKAGYVLTSCSLRFRQELGVFRKFEVHSAFVAMDDRHVWKTHTFRHADPNDNKIRAQVIAKGAFIKRGKVVDPRQFLVEDCQMDQELINSMLLTDVDSLEQDEILALSRLEESQRAIAAADDAR